MFPIKPRNRYAAMGFGPLFNADGADGGGADKPTDGATAKPEDKGGEGKPAAKPEDKAKPVDTADLQNRFDAQRKVNTDLQAKLDQFKDGLKSALGIEDKTISVDDVVSKMQTQLDDLAHTNLVSDVARTHKITDADDLALLSDIKDKDAMEKFAARLAPSEDDTTKGKPRSPRPDPSQGTGGGGSAARASSVTQVMADRQAARKAQ